MDKKTIFTIGYTEIFIIFAIVIIFLILALLGAIKVEWVGFS